MTTCAVTVFEPGRGGWNHPCGRPVKGNLTSGTPVCGIHLAAERRSLTAAASRRERERESREHLAEAQVVIDGLARYGIVGSPALAARGFDYSGGVVIRDGAAVLALLDRMGGPR